MPKPTSRSALPVRKSDNERRCLLPLVEAQGLAPGLLAAAWYRGSPKHKANPALYGLPPFQPPRGDATLCDTHAGFQVAQIASTGDLLRRGIRSGLIGNRMLWTIADTGWIFEARLTNAVQLEYHGYPVLPSESIADPVWRRFQAWAAQSGSDVERQASQLSMQRYRIRP